MQTPLWIAADWGTSNLRLWGIGRDDKPVFALSSDKGMGSLTAPDYPRVLKELLAGHLPDTAAGTVVVVCGMAGAREGWKEASYMPLPARLDALGDHAARPEMPASGLRPFILPGLCAAEPGQENVMRGEETQLLGLLALDPDFEGVACLPGTHSKWVQIENGRVTRFETAMTGELFDILSTRSVLRHAIKGVESGPEIEDGIAAGLTEGLATPERLILRLFRTRAASLLSARPPDWCRGYLSGLLVGSEIAAQRHWRGAGPVALVGSERLCRLYAVAIARDGGKTTTINAESATLAGLAAARRRLMPS